MRRLLYVPIIHEEADLGSAGATLAQRSAILSGERRWMIHKEIVRQFWESVAAYLYSLDCLQLKVYQDGLAAEGEVGRRIVEKAAERGSRNYQLVLDVLTRGAELRKTEDPILLLRERENILELVKQPSAEENRRNIYQYALKRDRLMEQRDKFIAETIEATLKEGELGMLFIGANHNVASLLATDVSVEMVKNPQKLQAYLEELFSGHDDQRLEALGQALT